MNDVIHYFSHCEKAQDCTINSCFFRLKQVFGHPIFGSPVGPNPLVDAALEDAKVKPEDTHWPDVSARSGTNCVSVHCSEFRERKK